MVLVVAKKNHQGDNLQQQKKYKIEITPDEQKDITHAKRDL